MKDIFPYVRRLHEGIIACYNTFHVAHTLPRSGSHVYRTKISSCGFSRLKAITLGHFHLFFNLWGTLFALLIFAIERPSMISITRISWLQILLIGGLLLDTGSMNELIFSEKTSGCIDDRRPVPSGSNHSFYWCNYISS